MTTKMREILSIGIDLTDSGVNNYALTETQVLGVIDTLQSKGVAILGGDVYHLINDQPQLSYDNWYCDPKDGETEEYFVKRSADVAKHYVSMYSQRNAAALFAIVI